MVELVYIISMVTFFLSEDQGIQISDYTLQ